MSNFPLTYKLSWLPRLLRPSLAGGSGFSQGSGQLMAKPPAASVRLAFLGDVSAVANRGVPEIDPALSKIIASADLVVANCESPVVENPIFPVATRFGLLHAMTAAFLDAVLNSAAIRPDRLVLSLANNHALDQGSKGLEETLTALSARGIRAVGTPGEGPVQRVRTGPLAVGFLAFTQWRNHGEDDCAGRVTMLEDIDGWPSAGPSRLDMICALPHWDWEFRHFPRTETRALARSLVASGCGLIAGHHAHVVQGVETIGGVPVAYGLGDFLGTALPRQLWPGRIGAILIVDVSIDPGSLGTIAMYRMVPFLRLRQRRNERLMPVDAVGGTMGRKVHGRLSAIFDRPAGGQARRETL